MKYYCAFIGIVIFLIAIKITIKKTSFLFKANKVEGTVSGHTATTRIKNGSRHPFYYPTISFTHFGKAFEFVGEVGSSSQKSYKINQKVKVYFDPVNPDCAYIGNFFTFWFAPLALAVLSTGAITAAVQMHIE